MPPTIAHIINPVRVKPTSDLYHAQPVTFATMLAAKEYAQGKATVTLYSAQYEEDAGFVPHFFTQTPHLTQAAPQFGKFTHYRKLPLIREILQRLYDASTADFLIYTNVDIAVTPNFYEAVAYYIEQGYDAFMINRRRIAATYRHVHQIPAMVAEVGLPHPGFDCFVFHRDLFPLFKLENICIGVPFIEISLSHNLYCYASNFVLLADKHLTFHIGREVFKDWADKEYVAHNRREFAKIKTALMPHLDIRRFPYANLPFFRRYLSWIFNPAMQIGICLPLEWRAFKKKCRYRFNEFFLRFISGWH